MNRREFVSLAAVPLVSRSQESAAKSDYPITPVSYRDVQITDPFWTPRIDISRTVTVPSLLDRAEKNGRVDLRTFEGACYHLAKHPEDAALKARVDGVVDRLTSATGGSRGGGDLFFAAAAHYEVTGSRKLLDVAIQSGDNMVSTFGPDKSHAVAGHEGVKMGLIRLYRVTEDDRYVKLAQFLLDERGNFEKSKRASFGWYAQDHEPVKAQTRAIGHCVRATYLYGALTDIAALTGDPEYARAAERIWEDAVTKRTYLTGGIGSYPHCENYSMDDYDLPNLGCWNEICAACGNTWWNHRMFLLKRDAKYADLMERILYNGFLAGVSLSGDKFLYQTPLKAYGSFARQPSFGPNCCPPNVARLLPSLGNLIYAHDDEGLYVNLFVGSKAQVKLKQAAVAVEQETRYPWGGTVKIVVNPGNAANFAIFIRIPGWARNEATPGLLYRFASTSDARFTLTVNGRPASYAMERGFAKIGREWAKGDTIELSLPMPVRKVLARDQVADDRGMVAFERGPLVYCAEGVDHDGKVFNLVVPDKAELQYVYRKDLLNGVGTLTGKVLALRRGNDRVSVSRREQAFTAIPYYAFGHRGTGEMAVWLARQESKAELPPVPTIASTSRATSSCGNGTVADNYPDHKPPTIDQRLYPSVQNGSGDISAIYDQIEPVNSEDGSSYYLRLHPQSGDQAWVQYDFGKPLKISSVEVYWKDDKQYCPLPRAWRLMYQDGDQWKPVSTASKYGVEPDKFNKVTFAPLTTAALRLEIQLQPKTYKANDLGPPDANWLRNGDVTWYECGVIEWRVNA